MTPDDRARYLSEGPEGARDEHLDRIRAALGDPATWAAPPPGVVDGVASGSGVGIVAVRARWWPWAAVAAAVVVAAVVFAGSLMRAPDAPSVVVAMAGTELAPQATGTAELRETASGWWIRLDVEGLAPAPIGSFYQGWVWDRGDGVSIGTFHLRGGAEPVILWSGVDVADYPSIWVTLQDEGAGPAASGRIMLRGEFAP